MAIGRSNYPPLGWHRQGSDEAWVLTPPRVSIILVECSGRFERTNDHITTNRNKSWLVG